MSDDVINNVLPDGSVVVLTRKEIEGCPTATAFRDHLVAKVQKAKAEHRAAQLEPLRTRTVERCKAKGLTDTQANEVWNEVLTGIEADRQRQAEQDAAHRTRRHFEAGMWSR